jgi:hypothetical protein
VVVDELRELQKSPSRSFGSLFAAGVASTARPLKHLVEVILDLRSQLRIWNRHGNLLEITDQIVFVDPVLVSGEEVLGR